MAGSTAGIQLSEHTKADEQLRFWVMQNGEWRLKIDEYPSVTWNGGLAFSARKAFDGGARVSTDDVGAQGAARMRTVTWTLVLRPVS
jgi:hypothetical protein